jgi:hypothetical protein
MGRMLAQTWLKELEHLCMPCQTDPHKFKSTQVKSATMLALQRPETQENVGGFQVHVDTSRQISVDDNGIVLKVVENTLWFVYSMCLETVHGRTVLQRHVRAASTQSMATVARSTKKKESFQIARCHIHKSTLPHPCLTTHTEL